MMSEQEYKEAVRSMRNRTTRMDREGDYWTDDEKEKLRFIFNSGEGITDIAIQLQRSEPAVMQQIEKMDLYQRKENPQRRRSGFREARCLCEACRMDAAACPRSKGDPADREGM